MEKLKATLQRKVGPFSVGAWLIILVAGVGIGLLVRRRFATSEDSSGFATEGPADSGFPFAGGVNTPGSIVTGRAPETTYERGPDQPDIDRDVDQDGINEKDAPKKTGTTKPKPKPKPAPKPAPKPKPPPKVTKPKAKTYTVQSGDTLWKIAGKFGFSHWRPIYDANVKVIGSNPDLIRPGQKLVIPAK